MVWDWTEWRPDIIDSISRINAVGNDTAYSHLLGNSYWSFAKIILVLTFVPFHSSPYGSLRKAGSFDMVQPHLWLSWELWSILVGVGIHTVLFLWSSWLYISTIDRGLLARLSFVGCLSCTPSSQDTIYPVTRSSNQTHLSFILVKRIQLSFVFLLVEAGLEDNSTEVVDVQSLATISANDSTMLGQIYR